MATPSSSLRSANYRETELELNGWPVRLTSYKVGDTYVCQADDVSPGACLARFTAPTLEEAEAQAISKAKHLLSKTKRREV